jgi:hypothetical protein
MLFYYHHLDSFNITYPDFTSSHQALGKYFHKIFLRFTHPLCHNCRDPSIWYLQFSSESQLGMSTMKGLCPWFRLRESKPNFKEFFASPAWMPFQVLRSFLFQASKQTKNKIWIKTRFNFVITIVALGSLCCDKLV